MKKSELLKVLENISDDHDVDDILKSTDFVKTFVEDSLTLDKFKKKIETDKEFKSFMESENDKHHNKALNTWKENNLEKELEPFIQKKYPELIKDPVQKEILELKQQLEKERLANARKDLLSQATQYASEKKLPVTFIEKFLEDDFDKTKVSIDSFATEWSKEIESMVNERIKSSTYIPGGEGSDDSNGGSLGSRLAKQSPTINKNYDYFGGAK